MDSVGSCLRHYPGEVVALVRGAELDGDYGATVVTKASVSGLDMALVLYRTTPGMEIRLLHDVVRGGATESASLNYLLQDCGDSNSDARPSKFSWYVLNGQELEESEAPDSSNLAIAIDLTKGHCKDVLKAMKAGLPRRSRPSHDESAVPKVFGIVTGTSRPDAFTLFDYSEALLQIVPIRNNVLTVNMSVDFVERCNAGQRKVPPFTITGFSFPVFEDILDRLFFGENSGEANRPYIFAAAGNHKERGGVQWRLGYPAIVPTVCAVSFHNERYGIASVAAIAAIPASLNLKPVVSLDLATLPKGCPNNGTSFASAFVAGAVAGAMAAQGMQHSLRGLGPLGLIAHFSSLCRPIKLKSPAKLVPLAWMPVVVHSVPIPLSELMTRKSLPGACNLADELNKKFAPMEFVVHGSFAALSIWCNMYNVQPSALSNLTMYFGDVDLFCIGDDKASNVNGNRAVEAVSKWMKATYGRNWEPHKVDLHPLTGRSAGMEYVRGVAPILALAATSGGILDPFAGLAELTSADLELYLPSEDTVVTGNPTITSGIIFGEVVLNWLSSILLIRIVATAVEVKAPRPTTGSIKRIRKALKYQASVPGLWSRAQQASDSYERFERRVDRVRSLLAAAKDSGAEMKCISTLFDDILKAASSKPDG